jgi:hypothetical protein
VDPADYKRLRQYEWIAKKGRNSFYAIRYATKNKAGNAGIISMHRQIIKVPHKMLVDHINHDGMDNTSANLRPATHAQNSSHRKKRSCPTQSKYKGVSWKKDNRKWQARIGFQNKAIYLGCFRNEIDAAKAYDRAAMKYHGEFASLNFPASAERLSVVLAGLGLWMRRRAFRR